MESKKINQLATELAPDLSDLTIIGDPTTGISKKITLSQMASLFTGTVEEYANLAAFPLVGVADTIYIALDTNILYRWNTGTSAYVELSPNIVSSLVFNDANGFDGTINLVGSVATLTITTALTTGSVGFIGASGALLQDNANFFWDDTNNRLGLGTNAPTTALDVFGSGIIGRLNATSTNNAYLGFASNGTNKWSAGNVQSDHRFRIFSEANSAELITILQTGEFGIGIANPTTKLHIDGGASALIANLDANVSVAKSVSFRSDNSNRFNIEVSGTESGSNAGADLFIRRYSDAGALIDTPLTIVRSTGYASFTSNVAIGKTASSTFIFDALKEDSTTNSIIGIAQFGRSTTGTAANGIGGNIQLTAEDNAGNQRTAAYIGWKLTNVSSSAPEGYMYIGSRNAPDALNIYDSGVITTNSSIATMVSATGASIKIGGFTNYGTIQDVNDVRRIWFENTGSYRTIFDLPSSGTSFVYRTNAGTNLLSLTSAGVLDLPFGQITFPATQNASSNANTLDDYEEGTYTVSVTSQIGSITLNTSYNTGSYTKIGNRVLFSFRVDPSSVSSPSGQLNISLPFLVSNGSGQPVTAFRSTANLFIYDSVATNINAFSGLIVQNTQNITVFIGNSTTGNDAAAQIKAGTQIHVSGLYVAA
jgi:hypothetical protein